MISVIDLFEPKHRFERIGNMRKAAEKKTAAPWLSADGVDLDRYIPEELRNLDDLQTEIPRLAKDSQAVQAIEAAIQRVPTQHHLYLARISVLALARP